MAWLRTPRTPKQEVPGSNPLAVTVVPSGLGQGTSFPFPMRGLKAISPLVAYEPCFLSSKVKTEEKNPI